MAMLTLFGGGGWLRTDPIALGVLRAQAGDPLGDDELGDHDSSYGRIREGPEFLHGI